MLEKNLLNFDLFKSPNGKIYYFREEKASSKCNGLKKLH